MAIRPVTRGGTAAPGGGGGGGGTRRRVEGLAGIAPDAGAVGVGAAGGASDVASVEGRGTAAVVQHRHANHVGYSCKHRKDLYLWVDLQIMFISRIYRVFLKATVKILINLHI